jgi:hypothetical protein
MSFEEFLARVLAARKMQLIKDPHGQRIPEDLWRKFLPDAEFIVGAIMAFDMQKMIERFHHAEDEDE